MSSRRVLPLAGLLLTISLSAHAETHGGGDVEMSVGAYDDATVLTPQISGWLSIDQRVRVEASFGFAHLAAGGESQLELGNPYLGAAFTLPTRARAFAGLGVALPVASIPDDLLGAAAALATYTSAWNVRALRDLWLWFPDTLSVVLSGGAATPAGSGFEVSVKGHAAVLVPTKTAGRDKAELDLQLVGTGAYAIGSVLKVGVDLGAVWVPTGDGDSDNFQLSVEPFVRANLGPVSARVGLTLPIDEPLGPPFEGDAGWGLRVGVGFAL
jgi:hypothetical protein